MNVTAFIAIVAKARPHILRLSTARLHDLVVSDWRARAVLRYWRLKRRWHAAFNPPIRRNRIPPSINLVGHALVLSLGLVLVAPVVTGGSFSVRSVAAEYSGHVLWMSPAHARSAPEMRELTKASTLEERPAPPVADSTTAIVPHRRPPAQGGAFTAPRGSSGDGLAAIYAVFGNSRGLSWALRVAYCESRYNPLAVNRSSGASGLFQFMPSTWNANFPGQNIWDPYAQSRGALVFYNAGRQSAWTCK